ILGHLEQSEGREVELAFNLDYYTEVLDLSYLVDHLASDPFFRNFRRLNEKLVEVIQDYSLVSFVPLNVQVTQHGGQGAALCLLRTPGWEMETARAALPSAPLACISDLGRIS
uniref:GPN-loop GTPase 2 n=1 Tax=Malurus cyaneus samueli TaxID=2593467 RepID=A0A8C5TQP7_9PASS